MAGGEVATSMKSRHCQKQWRVRTPIAGKDEQIGSSSFGQGRIGKRVESRDQEEKEKEGSKIESGMNSGERKGSRDARREG